ncbi:MAG: serine protease [Hyphomicrobiaceae bacterium]|nr:serine protease [Hyphomicrobiaceae bacterium]
MSLISKKLLAGCTFAAVLVAAQAAQAQATGLGTPAPAAAPAAGAAIGGDAPAVVKTKRVALDRPTPIKAARARLAKANLPGTERGKVVGGVAAPKAAYPFQVSMIIADTPVGKEGEGHYCGGSLIAPTWVLTAAHCVFDLESDPLTLLPAKGTHVYVGSNNFTKGDRVRVKRVVGHSKFDPDTMDNDIALLELERVPKSGIPAQIIQLVSPADEAAYTRPGTPVKVTGWGAMEEGGDSAVLLQEVSIKTLDNGVCQSNIVEARSTRANMNFIEAQSLLRFDDKVLGQIAFYAAKNAGPIVRPSMLCAGALEGGKDSCQGDSGGPLFAVAPDKKFVQVGVVSWGDGCAQPKQPGLYTRLSRYIDWIQGAMK